MSIHIEFKRDFRRRFRMPINVVEPVPRNIRVETSAVENGILIKTTWDHPTNGMPDHYEWDINFSRRSGIIINRTRRLTGIQTEYSYVLSDRRTVNYIELVSIKDDVSSETIRILASAFSSGTRDPSTSIYVLTDGSHTALIDSGGNILGGR